MNSFFAPCGVEVVVDSLSNRLESRVVDPCDEVADNRDVYDLSGIHWPGRPLKREDVKSEHTYLPLSDMFENLFTNFRGALKILTCSRKLILNQNFKFRAIPKETY